MVTGYWLRIGVHPHYCGPSLDDVTYWAKLFGIEEPWKRINKDDGFARSNYINRQEEEELRRLMKL